MDSPTFYASIFPPAAYRVLATFRGGLKNPPTHTFYKTDAELITAAEAADSRGFNVYHATAVYTAPINRKGENVAASRVIALDLDVGPSKHYTEIRTAAAAVERFRLAAKLAAPHLVKSGGGLHVYFPLEKPLAPPQWSRLAAAMAACLDHAGVVHDKAVTENIAAVLRVPGTSNYKLDTPRPVRLLRLGTAMPAGALFKALKDYAAANELFLPEGQSRPARGPVATNDLVGTTEYPPSIGANVARHCAVLSEVEATGGDCDYDIWWLAMGIAKHVEDADAVAAHWTRDRQAGHDKADWKAMIDNWPTPPSTCEKFSKKSPACAACPHFGKIKSPIVLGYDAQPVIQVVPVAAPPAATTTQAVLAPVARPAATPMPGTWSFGEQWVVDAVCKATKTGFSNGRLHMSVQQEDGSYKHVQLCSRYWQVLRRVRTADGVWRLEIGYQDYPGLPHKTFMLDSSAVTAADKLRSAFSDHELHIYGGQKGMSKTQEIIMWEQENLYGYQLETITYPAMGWATHDNKRDGVLTGEFVVGDTLLRPNKPPVEVLLDDRVVDNLRSAFTTSGTTAEWVHNIDTVYNRPRAEPYQFVIAAALAAPLVQIVPGEGDWHGIPVVLIGKTGAAKTSTALVAMSLYGKPQALKFNAQRSKSGGQGDTAAAFAAKVAALRNLPFIADEMTGVEPEVVAETLYMLANGKSKDRCFPDGTTMPNPNRWDVISIATGNESLHEKLRLIKDPTTQDATRYRCFEITMESSDLQTLFPDVNKTFIEHDMLGMQYGAAGREWLQFLVNNRVAVAANLSKLRSVYRITDNDTSAIRFYKDLLLTVEVAARLARAKGLIKWDVKAMMNWARAQLSSLEDSVIDRDWDSTIAAFIGSLHGRTVVTKHASLGRGRRHVAEAPLEPLNGTHHPVARRAIEDRVFYVQKAYMTKWCIENRITESVMVLEMHAKGYLRTPTGETPKPSRRSIGSGTSVTSATAPCWDLDVTKLAGAGSDDAGQGGDSNVVPMTPRPTPPEPAALSDALVS